MSDQSPGKVLLVANLAWVFITLILLVFLDSALSIASAGTASRIQNFWNLWLVSGTILGVGDAVYLYQLFSGIAGGY